MGRVCDSGRLLWPHADIMFLGHLMEMFMIFELLKKKDLKDEKEQNLSLLGVLLFFYPPSYLTLTF